MVVAGFEVIKYVFNLTVGIDQEADSVNAVVGFTHKGLLTPDAEFGADLMVFVGEQRKVQQLFFDKAGQFFWLIGADTQHFYACRFQIVHVIA
ncbi:hypothetical protein D3C75_1247190 [compost metagenome]